MKIVIDIPEEEYNLARFRGIIHKDTIFKAIMNSIPLPKGHGRLIDADAFIKFMQTVSKTRKYDELWIDNFLTVDDVFNAVIASIKNEGTSNGNAPTVIEADKEVDNER